MTTEQIDIHGDLNKAFKPHQPIELPELLAGRIDLLNRVMDALNTDGLHVVLFGDRGVGKTSLARVVSYLAQEPASPDGRRAIFVSCGTDDTFPTIWQKVLQQVLVRQRQLGFVQHAALEVTGNLGELNPQTPNDLRMIVTSMPYPMVIIIDEFDRTSTGGNIRALMADTIKLFADHSVASKVVLVGVAESINELFKEHLSIPRNTANIEVPPMSLGELAEIVQKGYRKVGLTYDTGLDNRVANLAQGYPSYAHLLGLWAGRKAVTDLRTNVTTADLDAAISAALENAIGGAQFEYEQAIATSQPGTFFKDVLLSCSLAQKDPLGKFSAVDVRGPLRRLTSRPDYSTAAFQGHLAKFCEKERGPVLKRTGRRRHYRWQFINPQLIPYIRLRGIKDGRLNGDGVMP